MISSTFPMRMALSTAAAALVAASIGTAVPAPALAQPSGTVQPAEEVALSAGTGRLVRLNGTMSDLFVANDGVADVQVRSTNQVYIFGKSAGETTVYATNKAGKVIYSATVRVGTNIGSIQDMLKLAMPEARIQATPMNGMVLLTGTVGAPADIEEANRLVQAFLGTGTQVISRLKTATPLQVMVKVKFAGGERNLLRNVGVNTCTDRGGRRFGAAAPGYVQFGRFDPVDRKSTRSIPASVPAPCNFTGTQRLARGKLLAGLSTSMAENTTWYHCWLSRR
jgi:pilus assembly protein CpaC